MKKLETQTLSKHDEIRGHLYLYGHISGREAFDGYDVYRLSSIIERLRNREGMGIETVMQETSKGASYARYMTKKYYEEVYKLTDEFKKWPARHV